MDKSLILELIDAIKVKTVDKKIKWKTISTNLDIYSSSNRKLRNYIIENSDYGNLYNNKKDIDLDLDKSYFAAYKDGYIYLFSCKSYEYGDFVSLVLQSEDSDDLHQINEIDINNDYNYDILVKLSALMICISHEVKNIENYVNTIINSSDE
ncbi:hypothetical protein IMX26_04070 [Clostridium sp. 'deep sea']|uniref:hypothetical protein n=1 Tax=Clostridium sp. 'deep sea' TaxID=2779445 RepID=UPI0018967B6A|nr:hypothetical protein [Clostridium sp. 'deep sea']QOR36000.1 hypothetical protein IMX26_04070 [Clostridium sp. 'deep sea']